MTDTSKTQLLAVDDDASNSQDRDVLYGFMFNEILVRGVYVHVQKSIQTFQNRQRYPHGVASLLIQMQIACAILSANIKLEGRLSLQLRGVEGLLKYALVECSVNLNRQDGQTEVVPFTCKGMAKHNEDVHGQVLKDDHNNLHKLMGQEGRLIITIEPKGGERYQGIVALEYDNLSACLSAYFTQSEQLTTHFHIDNDAVQGAGFMLQRLPSPVIEAEAEQADADWHDIHVLAASLQQDELLNLPIKQILYRLFHEYDKQLFTPRSIVYQCDCSRDRCGLAIASLGQAEVDNMLAEQTAIIIDCQFCQAQYSFDKIDCNLLFLPDSSKAHSQALH